MVVNVHASSRRKQKKSRSVRAFLNGVDLSHDCYYADSKRGFVRCYKRDADGKVYLNQSGRDVAKEERHGSVIITRNV